MFKKLKTNILIMNVSIITVLLVTAFISIYVVTRGGVFQDIETDFRRASYSWYDVKDSIEEEGYIFSTESFNNYLKITENYYFLESRLGSSYILLTDSSGNLLQSIGFYDDDYRIFSTALNEINWDSEEIQYLTFDDLHWAYRIRATSDGKSVMFMNVSRRMGVLSSLVFTSLIIFMVTMVFVVFISIFMTNKSTKPVDEAHKRQKQFVSDASHELRTPLASINANADLILSKSYIRPAERKWLDYIKTEAMRMSNLTQELLYLSELDEQSKAEMDITEIDLSYLAENYILGMEAMFFEKKLQLSSEIEKGIKIKGDRERISQIFIILIENAINYTPENGNVSLTLKKLRNVAEIKVSNTGVFIPAEQITKIFDRFYKLDKSRGGKATSHGLGLSIAKSIVERHGGNILCQSEPGGNTSFIVTLNII